MSQSMMSFFFFLPPPGFVNRMVFVGKNEMRRDVITCTKKPDSNVHREQLHRHTSSESTDNFLRTLVRWSLSCVRRHRHTCNSCRQRRCTMSHNFISERKLMPIQRPVGPPTFESTFSELSIHDYAFFDDIGSMRDSQPSIVCVDIFMPACQPPRR